MLSVGTEVLLGNGERRKITKVWKEGSAIYVDGARLNPSVIGAPYVIEFVGLESERKMALFEKAFGVPELGKIPVAWGKSEDSLLNKMELVKKLDSISPSIHDLALENGAYKIVGSAPQLFFDISVSPVSGRDAGLLRFEFTCMNKTTQPNIQVFWWGDKQPGSTEAASLRFTADDGTLIVPLDAYPRWLLLDGIQGIRIGLDNAAACGAISVKNISLYQRRIFR